MIAYFFVYGFLGWIIDSGYRSLECKKWTRGGFSFLPFTPSYGLAAVILIFATPYVLPLPHGVQWLILGVVFAAYEYACGHLSVLVMKRRLWDYTGHFLNLHGHTDFLHALYWATLAYAVLHWFHPWLAYLLSLK